jgi:hypothetical protein
MSGYYIGDTEYILKCQNWVLGKKILSVAELWIGMVGWGLMVSLRPLSDAQQATLLNIKAFPLGIVSSCFVSS